MTHARRARLLMFNLATDVDDTILGFTHDWIRSLARRIDQIDVVTMRAGRVDLPDNVRVFSVGTERGLSEPRRAVEFYRILARLQWLRGYDACFAHMMPLFAVMASPVLRARRIPLTLWYTHPATSPLLRAAIAAAQTVITASPESVKVASRKILVTGHGIDTTLFSPSDSAVAGSGPFRIVSVGRIAPIKGLERIVDAAVELRPKLRSDLCVTLVGDVLPGDEGYARDLTQRIDAAGLSDTFRMAGAMAREQLPRVLRESSVAVNFVPQGGYDKAVLEAMSCGIPVVTTNTSFRPLLQEANAGDLLVTGGPVELATALLRVAELDPEARTALGDRLRNSVVEHHSLERLADQLTEEILFR